MRKAVFVFVMLAVNLMLALPALAATPPYAKVDQYRIVISGFADKLIFESELQVKDGSVASIWSEDNANPKQTREAIFIVPPQAPLADLAKALADKVHSPKPLAFRTASVHGVQFYWYCPEAQWVHIRLYITPAYETTERYLATIDVDP